MLGIACRVHTILRIEYTRRILLCLTAHYKTVALLGVDIVYIPLFAFEVIPNLVRLIGGSTISEHRQTHGHAGSIDAARRMHHTAVHVHLDNICSKFNLVITDLARTIEIGISVA